MGEIKQRKHLCADALFDTIHSGFEKINEHRTREPKISLPDALMSGFAMFSLKDASLLAFEERRNDQNIKNIYHITNVPSDTQMREILDKIEPDTISPLFADIFREFQRGKLLENYVFLNGCYLLSIDGCGYFSSHDVHCESCLEKKNKKTGEITYQHQMLGAVIVHPDIKEVIPLTPEPIIKQDGNSKNDCERNASKRFFEKLRKQHPHLPLIVVEDGLASNAPHIHELNNHNMHYILGAKEGDHKSLFLHVEAAEKDGLTTEIVNENEKGEIINRLRFINQVPLNESNSDTMVNFLEYWEVKNDRTLHFSWVTDITITLENANQIMRGGRARWKIENETFNTLKNQGYHFEHNYGHGKQNLSVVFAFLMMLAFLVDQIQQHADHLFQAVLAKCGTKRSLWENMRSMFRLLEFDSMEKIFKAMLYGYKIQGFTVLDSHT